MSDNEEDRLAISSLKDNVQGLKRLIEGNKIKEFVDQLATGLESIEEDTKRAEKKVHNARSATSSWKKSCVTARSQLKDEEAKNKDAEFRISTLKKNITSLKKELRATKGQLECAETDVTNLQNVLKETLDKQEGFATIVKQAVNNLKRDNLEITDGYLRKDQVTTAMGTVSEEEPSPKRTKTTGNKAARINRTIDSTLVIYKTVPDGIATNPTFKHSDELQEEHESDKQHPTLLQGLNAVARKLKEGAGYNGPHGSRMDIMRNGWTEHLGEVILSIMSDQSSEHRYLRLELLFNVYLQVLEGKWALTPTQALDVRTDEAKFIEDEGISLPDAFYWNRDECAKRFVDGHNRKYSHKHGGNTITTTFNKGYPWE